MKYILIAILLTMTACTAEIPQDVKDDIIDIINPPTEEPKEEPPVKPKVEVYEGCEALTEPNGTVITIGEGKDFKDITALDKTKTLKGGETLEFYGTIDRLIFNKWKTPNLENNSKYIYLDFSKGDVQSVEITNASHLAIMNASMRKKTLGNTIITRDSNNIVIHNMTITGRDSIEGLTAKTWQELPGGISLLRTKCASVTENKLSILRGGIGASMDSVLTYPENSSKTLIKNNVIRHISGDVHRMNASDLTIEGTDFKEGWVSGKDGDLNHDDFVQGFGVKGEEYQNVKILNNTFIEAEDPTRALIGDYQGIAVFDGKFKNMVIKGNTVRGGAYHGISLYAVDTALIENNTVLTTVGRKFWISIFTGKEKWGSIKPKNITVRGNTTSHLGTALTKGEYENIVVENNTVIAPTAVKKVLKK